MRQQAPNMMEAALDYADQGFYVVPLHVPDGRRCSCQNGRDCQRPGKHPVGFLVRDGATQASAYPKTIERWWTRFPGANIGIVCGPSEVVVLDVDPRNGGLESLGRLEETHGPLPDTMTAVTGGEEGTGRHYVFADPRRVIVGRKGDGGEGAYPGLEILAGGNLFVAAPSLHKSGRRYAWLDRDALPVRAPEWMKGGFQ